MSGSRGQNENFYESLLTWKIVTLLPLETKFGHSDSEVVLSSWVTLSWQSEGERSVSYFWSQFHQVKILCCYSWCYILLFSGPNETNLTIEVNLSIKLSNFLLSNENIEFIELFTKLRRSVMPTSTSPSTKSYQRCELLIIEEKM